jgi:hypothetical protein
MTKQFRNGADKETVAKLYGKLSKKQLGGIKELHSQALAVPIDLWMACGACMRRRLGCCLNLCARLQVLTLVRVGLTDAAWLRGALLPPCRGVPAAQLQELYLYYNQIGNEGMTSFSAALVSGAMAQLEKLGLYKNWIGSEGMVAFSTALASRALSQLTDLNLSDNGIGAKAMASFMKEIGYGAMAKVTSLNLNGSDVGAIESQLIAALAGGKMAQLKKLKAGCYP